MLPGVASHQFTILAQRAKGEQPQSNYSSYPVQSAHFSEALAQGLNLLPIGSDLISTAGPEVIVSLHAKDTMGT